MRKTIKYFAVLCLVVAAASCKSQYEELLESMDSDTKYNAAMEFFENKKYSKAAQLFESLAVLTSGTERDDTVQYYWGLSNYRMKDYYTAEANFLRFIQNYPQSPFSEHAQFLRLDCLYRGTYRYELDQTPSRNCIASIEEFKMLHPNSEHTDICDKMIDNLKERIEHKAFDNAYIYYKMEDYKAARVAFRNVLKEGSENRYREEILYYMAMSSYKYADLSVPSKQRERFLVFLDDYYNFVGEYPESSHKRELDSLYRKVKNKE